MFSSSTWTSVPGAAAHAPAAAYRPDIDGLRAVAVLSVVLNHLSALQLPGGHVGVDVFFVISGYLITGIISREMAEGRFSFRRFYERRARRIFPALFAMLAVTLAACLFIMLPTDFIGTVRAGLGTLLFASNVVFWQMDTGYFEETDSRTNPLLHTWSLAVEEQFYLLFPLFLLACMAWARRRATLVLAACAVLSFAVAALLVRSNASAAFYLSPFRAWELLAGALLAMGALPPVRSALLRELLVGGGLCAILAACVAYGENTRFPGTAALLPVLGAAAIIHGGSGGSTLAGRFLASGPMVYMGLISYSLYLWHWPVIVLAQYLNGMEPATRHAGLLLVLSLLLAALSYHLVETPFRRPAGAQPPRRGLWQAAGFAAAGLVFCAAGLVTAGFPGRFAPAVAEMDAVRRQPLPYHDQCNDRDPDKACRLGAAAVEPKMLLWGDSHLLSMAPALHELLLKAGASAVFVPATACAPLMDVDSRIKSSCRGIAERVQEVLAARPELQTVVLSGFWSTYFREHGPLLWASGQGEHLEAEAAAAKGLQATVRWLLEHRRKTIVIGPVPTYEKNVAAALALQERDGVARLDLAQYPQRQKNALFAGAVRALPPDSRLQAADPLAWMCNPQCAVAVGGKSLYRDAHHLSTEGALALRQPIAEVLGLGGGPGR
jgi:peptidoglycan/LPS O-acetylase OafA/YrhL